MGGYLRIGESFRRLESKSISGANPNKGKAKRARSIRLLQWLLDYKDLTVSVAAARTVRSLSRKNSTGGKE